MRTHVCMLAAAILITGSACDRQSGEQTGPNSAALAKSPDQPAGAPEAPDGRRIFVIGWDGMSDQIVRPLLDRGELPNLKRMADAGVYSTLETISPTMSAVIWTSVATGKAPGKHGITHFRYDDPETKERELFTAEHRRVKALWNILSERGVPCAVVGWWVTWPAEQVRGTLVTDRYAFNRFQLGDRNKPAADPGDIASQLYPPSLNDELSPLIMQPSDVTAEQLGRFVRGPVEVPDHIELRRPEDELRVVYAQDESNLRIAEHVIQSQRPRFVGVYFEGTDIVCHYFFKYRFPEEWAAEYEPIAPELVTRFGDTINAYFRLQDERLGRLLKLADENTTIIVMSDHGFRMGKTVRAGRELSMISGQHKSKDKPAGVVVISGAGVKGGATLSTPPHVYDIAPTVLALLGQPVAKDMDGRVWTEALESGALPADGPAVVPTYESGERTARRTQRHAAGDKAFTDRLHALGYLGTDDDEAERPRRDLKKKQDRKRPPGKPATRPTRRTRGPGAKQQSRPQG